MRIAYCLSYLWNSGGVDRVITVKANYLADKLGYDVAIITTDQHGRKPFFDLSPKVKLIDLAINYTDTNKSIPGKISNALVKRHQHKHRLKTILDEFKPDISIAVTRRELPILYQIKSGGVKIAERHMNKLCRLNENNSKLQFLLTKQEEKWIGNYTQCITLTHEDKALWYRKDNIKVIPNPITIEPRTHMHNADSKRVIAVGRISYEKGYDRALQAWAIVSRRFPDWRFDIIGSTEDMAEYQKLERLKMALKLSTLHFLPPTTDIVAEYSKSAFLVLSSRLEGLPLVLMEAMTCGLPCVSFDCQCGPKDIISDGADGFLVKDGDIKSMAEAMIKLMGNRTLLCHMGAKALHNSTRYQLPAIMQRWDQLFKSLVKRTVKYK